MMGNAKVDKFYRVRYGGEYAGCYSNRDFNTLEEAQAHQEEIKVEETSEYFDYWEKVRAQTYIVLVTEIEERI